MPIRRCIPETKTALKKKRTDSLPDLAAQLPRQLGQALRQVRHDVLQVVDPVRQPVQVLVHLAPTRDIIKIIFLELEEFSEDQFNETYYLYSCMERLKSCIMTHGV